MADPPAPAAALDRRRKVRVRFQKTGRLRYIGHADLLRAWDRILRRSGLPVRYTEGFNPKPRMSLPIPLGLGAEGWDEVFEFELDESSPDQPRFTPEAIQAQLEPALLPGLTLALVSCHAAKESSVVGEVEYVVNVPATVDRAAVDQRLAEVRSAAHWPIVRHHPKKPPRTVDVRPFLLDLCRRGEQIVIRLAVREGTSVRHEELIHLLELTGVDGVRLIRTKVHLGETPTLPDLPLDSALDRLSVQDDSDQEQTP